MLVVMQGALAGLLPDVYGSLSFGACVSFFLLQARCRVLLPIVYGSARCVMLHASILCYLGSMLA